jgi:hypothetical protein
VHENSDDSYTILVNSRLNFERQQAAVRHELDHIDHGDIDSTMSADEIEKMRNEEE